MTKAVKLEWCENFVKATFAKNQCRRINTELFWKLAEDAGLWERDTYGTPMSEALAKLTTVEAVSHDDGNYLYLVFCLV